MSTWRWARTGFELPSALARHAIRRLPPTAFPAQYCQPLATLQAWAAREEARSGDGCSGLEMPYPKEARVETLCPRMDRRTCAKSGSVTDPRRPRLPAAICPGRCGVLTLDPGLAGRAHPGPGLVRDEVVPSSKGGSSHDRSLLCPQRRYG